MVANYGLNSICFVLSYVGMAGNMSGTVSWYEQVMVDNVQSA